MIRLFVLSIAAVGLWAATAWGTSTPPVRLNPKNVGDQRHRVAVSADARGDVTHFGIRVAEKDRKTPPEVGGGYLVVNDGDRLVCNCPARSEPAGDAVTFAFDVAPGYLAMSRFSFTVATASPEERKNLPAGGGWVTYEFTLRGFALAPEGKQDPKGQPEPAGEPKRLPKPRGERYFAYWLTRDPPDPKDTAYEPLLLLARYSLEQFANEKELGVILRDLENPEQPPAEALEAVALTIETYKQDSIWDPDGRPFKPVRSIKEINLKTGHATVNGTRYQYEECSTGDAVRLLEYPEGTISIHRIHKPGAGPAQTHTFRALRALLREQLDSEASRLTPPRVRAFVAYLERNGIELVRGGARDTWWVVGQGQIREPLEVRIHGFSPVASTKWMRLVLDKTSWVAELNAPARLAMSKTIALANPDKKKPDELKALEEKLLRLFHEYEAPADVVGADKRVTKEQEDVLAFLKAKGVELRPTENGSNYISQMFTVGPNHDKKLLVGLNYDPPQPADSARRGPQIDIAIPRVTHRGWALFLVGGPGGNATEEYKAVWEKVVAAFKEYPEPAKTPDK